MTIVVFGSINMDLVARVPHLPAPGETLSGSDLVTVPAPSRPCREERKCLPR
jgi:sugar/nucleoside kinase (ribokinase family)